ncbi:phosphatidylinositol 3 and 4-kinase-domain-containing protein [Chlamydoabsidia padenii]|nr:phosphatidylinositol 3 and 4-kinase-domain-containing protein [Chlamydoabsidia padenii]
MFSPRQETTYKHQTYSRLQQDDGDDDLDGEDWSDLSQHPNSILVTNPVYVNDNSNNNNSNNLDDIDTDYAIVVLPQPFKRNSTNSATPGLTPPTSTSTTNNNNNHQSSSPSFLPNDSLAKLPQATRAYFNNKWLPTKATTATLTNMPSTIIVDIQQGNIPSHADPTLSELDTRGWTIAHRRLYQIRKQKKNKKKNKKNKKKTLAYGTGDTTDDDGVIDTHSTSLHLSNQLSASIFIKTEYDTESTTKNHVADDTKMNNGEPIPVSKQRYIQIVESVQDAIKDNIQPTRISQGSSGSYFCRDLDNTIVGVFKPKNEEPYGHLNPKWTKWFHRHLFPCFFGRSCLIPNLGYISEAAASLVDRQLGTCIVPTTHLDHFTSPSFHYDYLDRRRHRNSPQEHPLPLKIGSFQCFLHGYRDANVFLRDHPWPSSSLARGSTVWNTCLGQQSDDSDDGTKVAEEDDSGRKSRGKNNGYQPIASTEINDNGEEHHRSTTKGGYVAINMSNENGIDSGGASDSETPLHKSSPLSQKAAFQWTPQLQHQFKKEFEHLVILDYLIRNTDRGLDNWMIRYCDGNAHATKQNIGDSKASIIIDNQHHDHRPTSTSSCSHKNTLPHLHVAAIDNGLAFPSKHPDEWRSYPYGWLSLPNNLVARPFSTETRRRFLPVLSDPVWWHTTVKQLRQLFQVDSDFNERMFQRQMAVFRGQGYNLMRVLKDAQAGPVDLVAMERVLVTQEELFIEYDEKRLEDRKWPRYQHQQQVTAPSSETSSLSDPTYENTIPRRQEETPPLSSSPSDHQEQDQKKKKRTRRLRPKRSTSFHAMDSSLADFSTNNKNNNNNKRLPWKDRMRKRFSLDLGRRRHTGNGKRDNDDNDDASIDSSEEVPTRKRVLFVMETVKLVKSKLPYFSCC